MSSEDDGLTVRQRSVNAMREVRSSPVRASAQEEQRLTEIEIRYGRSVAGDPYPFADISYLLQLARGRQQAEQARDAHSAQCGKCGTWTCGYCGVSDPDGKWHCEKCWGFGPLAEATKRVAALTQALKDYRPIIELVRELQHASASLVHDSPETYSAYGLAVAKLLKAKLPAPPSPERRHE